MSPCKRTRHNLEAGHSPRRGRRWDDIGYLRPREHSPDYAPRFAARTLHRKTSRRLLLFATPASQAPGRPRSECWKLQTTTSLRLLGTASNASFLHWSVLTVRTDKHPFSTLL